MSVHRHSAPNPSDLETTAELPVLDVAAYEAQHADRLSSTDTWATPAPPASPARADDAPITQHRNRVEDDLRALSVSLREFEERLALKGARLNALESELEGARRARADRGADAAAHKPGRGGARRTRARQRPGRHALRARASARARARPDSRD